MEEILKILKSKAPAYVSGEELARDSGMTRAGIWKQIQGLRDIGYVIDSIPHRGYRLDQLTPWLHPFEIRDGLTARQEWTIHYQYEVGSTNRWARTLASQGAPDRTLVVAESQTEGRGRIGRHWVSPPGVGIWFSVILRPTISMAYLAGFTMAAAVVAARGIAATTGLDIAIKWPNDLLVNGGKLVGILAEMSGEADAVNYLILGIGINVNQQVTDFSPELAGKATSLRMASGKIYDRKMLLQRFLVDFTAVYSSLDHQTMAEIIGYARAHSATLGRQVTVNLGLDRTIRGKAVALDDDGSLWLETPTEGRIRIFSGDIIENMEG